MSDTDDDYVVASSDTIFCCPECGQRVLRERDGSYRPIAELQHNSAEGQWKRAMQFLIRLSDDTRLYPKRDYKEAMRQLHQRIRGHIGPWYHYFDEP